MVPPQRSRSMHMPVADVQKPCWSGLARGWTEAVRGMAAGLARVAAVAILAAGTAAAYDVVGYTAAANNRFSSGFPAAPVTNTSGSFVGLPYSWLGVGWATSDPTKGFGFLTPKHYLVAKHYGGATTISLLSAGGQVITGTEASVTDTGYGFTNNGMQAADIAIGELTASLPAA